MPIYTLKCKERGFGHRIEPAAPAFARALAGEVEQADLGGFDQGLRRAVDVGVVGRFLELAGRGGCGIDANETRTHIQELTTRWG